MVVSLNYCSQNGGNVYRAPYYNGNPNIGPRIIGNLDQYPCTYIGFRVEGPGFRVSRDGNTVPRHKRDLLPLVPTKKQEDAELVQKSETTGFRI